MKDSALRPEHFKNGKSFNPEDFRAFTEASDRLNRASWIRFLPAVIVGCAAGFACSRLISGIAGSILTIVCVILGWAAGTLLIGGAGKEVRLYMDRLGITPKDVSEARRNCKSGVTVWTAGEE